MAKREGSRRPRPICIECVMTWLLFGDGAVKPGRMRWATLVREGASLTLRWGNRGS